MGLAVFVEAGAERAVAWVKIAINDRRVDCIDWRMPLPRAMIAFAGGD